MKRRRKATSSADDVIEQSETSPTDEGEVAGGFDFESYLETYAKQRKIGIADRSFLAELQNLCPKGIRLTETDKEGNKFTIVRIPPFTFIAT